jgi:hypothetical protein
MKNLYIKYPVQLFIVFLFAGTSVHAQNLELGVRLMPVFSSLDFHTADGGTIKGEATAGYGFGGFVGVGFTRHVGIQAEVIYNSLLQKFKDKGAGNNVKLRYLNVPILLSLNTNKTGFVNLNVVAGPQIGINQGSSFKTDSNNGITSAQGVLSVKKNDLGLAYGAGVDFGLGALKTFRLGVGFRGVLGLIDISDNSKTLINGSYYVLDRTHITTYSAYAGISLVL